MIFRKSSCIYICDIPRPSATVSRSFQEGLVAFSMALSRRNSYLFVFLTCETKLKNGLEEIWFCPV